MDGKAYIESIDIHKVINKLSDEDIAFEMGMTRRNLVYIRRRVADGGCCTDKQIKKLKEFCENNNIVIDS